MNLKELGSKLPPEFMQTSCENQSCFSRDPKDRSLVLSDFDYQLPEQLVAQKPLEIRHHSRLIVRSPSGNISHKHTRHLTSELPQNALLILNDSRVIASRLFGHLENINQQGARVEIFLLSPTANSQNNDSVSWSAIGRPMKKLKPGTVVLFEGGINATVTTKFNEESGPGSIELKFNLSANDWLEWLDKFGYIPLPPYIKRKNPLPAPTSPDRHCYQTVYAKEQGSVAAPTAGLHFSHKLLEQIQTAGCEVRYASLHVGAGTFLPVKSESIAHHHMHTERYMVPKETVESIQAAKAGGRKVVAVGTTTLRCLESLYREAIINKIKPEFLADSWRETNLFLYPKSSSSIYRPKTVTGLMTNFHQPRSTLFMLVCSLIGLENAKSLYNEAIIERYRFFSYGDACLLWF